MSLELIKAVTSRLLVLLVACSATGLATGQSPNVHDHHVVFENGVAAPSHFYSQGSFVGPSELDMVDGKFPIETGRFVSPPNCLRLQWKSATGGDWRMALKVADRYGHRFRFDGDTLSLWCYSPQKMSPEAGPAIFLQDTRGGGVPTIPLLGDHGPLEAGKWLEVRVPLAKFSAQYGGTDEGGFDPRRLESITFVQQLDDGQPHTLYIDDVAIVDADTEAGSQSAAPSDLALKGYDRHFDLTWDFGGDEPKSYRVYRSWDGKEFEPVATRPGWSRRHMAFVDGPGTNAYFKVSAIDLQNRESPLSNAAGASTQPLDDEALLDMIQEGCFRYYWEAAHLESGMALEILPGDANLIAVGATGFGIMAQLVATERKFISRDESVARMQKILRFLQRADRFHGVWPHFLDGRTGRVFPYFGKYDNGGDLVETAFLVQGLLAARQYFNRDTAAEREIREAIATLWHEVEWDWYRKSADSEVLYWHWSPDHEWHISHPLVGWNETLIVYLLAIASPTHGVPASMYHTGFAGQSDAAVRYRRGWSRTTQGDHYLNGNSYYGIKLDVGCGTGGDLFFTQFSFLGFDPRGKRDRYTNYFSNNRNLALINRAYCIDNPRQFAGYGPDCWGLSAGVHSGGGKPNPRDDNGTICVSAALGTFPYTPDESMAALKNFYRALGPKIWGVYGFHDGFNATDQWFDEVYMGLNQAQIVVGIENHRTGLVWKHFMANEEVGPALSAMGFGPDDGKTGAAIERD